MYIKTHIKSLTLTPTLKALLATLGQNSFMFYCIKYSWNAKING